MTYKKKKNLKDLNHPAPIHEDSGKPKRNPTWNDIVAMYPTMTGNEIREMLGMADRHYPKKIHKLSDP